MSTATGYRILDEPLPSGLGRFAVNPIWPLFGFMFGGAAFAWTWSGVNAYALGSPTRRREIGLAAAGLAGILVLAVGIGLLAQYGVLTKAQLPYAFSVLVLWKLGISYWIFALQNRTFELYQYFGGAVRSGLMVVVAFYFLRSAVLKGVNGNPLIGIFL